MTQRAAAPSSLKCPASLPLHCDKTSSAKAPAVIKRATRWVVALAPHHREFGDVRCHGAFVLPLLAARVAAV